MQWWYMDGSYVVVIVVVVVVDNADAVLPQIWVSSTALLLTRSKFEFSEYTSNNNHNVKPHTHTHNM